MYVADVVNVTFYFFQDIIRSVVRITLCNSCNRRLYNPKQFEQYILQKRSLDYDLLRNFNLIQFTFKKKQKQKTQSETKIPSSIYKSIKVFYWQLPKYLWNLNQPRYFSVYNSRFHNVKYLATVDLYILEKSKLSRGFYSLICINNEEFTTQPSQNLPNYTLSNLFHNLVLIHEVGVHTIQTRLTIVRCLVQKQHLNNLAVRLHRSNSCLPLPQKNSNNLDSNNTRPIILWEGLAHHLPNRASAFDPPLLSSAASNKEMVKQEFDSQIIFLRSLSNQQLTVFTPERQ